MVRRRAAPNRDTGRTTIFYETGGGSFAYHVSGHAGQRGGPGTVYALYVPMKKDSSGGTEGPERPHPGGDAAQQTWLQVLRNWERINALDWDSAAKYLVVAARNAALDMLKKERWNTSMPEDWDPPAPEDGQGEYQRLVELIRSLPEAYRRVLELKFVEEETNQEIARRLGLKESTVSTKVQRGRRLLLDAMEQEGYSYG